MNDTEMHVHAHQVLTLLDAVRRNDRQAGMDVLQLLLATPEGAWLTVWSLARTAGAPFATLVPPGGTALPLFPADAPPAVQRAGQMLAAAVREDLEMLRDLITATLPDGQLLADVIGLLAGTVVRVTGGYRPGGDS